MLEQAARVESARLSLVRPLVETNKVLAAKDLNEDELDDLLERSKSVLVRSELLEPFREQFALSHTLLSDHRLSPSRSVGSVSPTNDLSLIPCVIETDLDMADTNVCDVLFEEEIIPAPSQEVTRPLAPSFDASELMVVEDNFPEDVSALHDVEMLSVCPTSEMELDVAETIVCDVLFEEEIIPAPSQEVTRPPAPRFDSSELMVVEDNFPEDVSALHDVEMLSVCPTSEMELDIAETIVCDVLFEEEIIPAAPQQVTRAPAPSFDSTELMVVEDNFPEDSSAVDDVEMLSVCPDEVKMELYEAKATEVELYECEEEIILPTPVDVVDRPFRAPVCWPEERTCSPFVVDECRLEPEAETSTLTAADVEGAVLEKASVVESDVYLVEEENFIVEARVDVQQLLKLAQMWSEERCVSPFTDGNQFLRTIPSDADLSALAPQDHESEDLACAQIHEADVYYYEEESISVDVVCDLTQMMRMIQRDLIISEEQPVSPIQDESVFTQPLSTDVELISIEAADHVESPLSQATVDECDLYYYEEESMSVDVVCELAQTTKMTQRDLILSEERPASPVHDESVLAQPFCADVELVSVDAVEHRASPLSRATVDECDVYYFEEESYSLDVVCDVRQLVQRSTSPFAVDERVSPETVQVDDVTVESSTVKASDVGATDVAAVDKTRSSCYALPQVH